MDGTSGTTLINGEETLIPEAMRRKNAQKRDVAYAPGTANLQL